MVTQGNSQGHRAHPHSNPGTCPGSFCRSGSQEFWPPHSRRNFWSFLWNFGRILWDLSEEALRFGCFFGEKLLKFFHLGIYLWISSFSLLLQSVLISLFWWDMCYLVLQRAIRTVLTIAATFFSAYNWSLHVVLCFIKAFSSAFTCTTACVPLKNAADA